MKYSYNMERNDVVFSGESGINASFKDLCAVCDYIRYRNASGAVKMLEEISKGDKPIEFRRHNKFMGSRHELGGKKGRYPKKCAKIVWKVLVNACANAKNNGMDPDSMYVVHASSNKTIIIPRTPPKGVRAVRSGGYGYTTLRKSNIELAKVEIGIAYRDAAGLGNVMVRALGATTKVKSHAKKIGQAKDVKKDDGKMGKVH